MVSDGCVCCILTKPEWLVGAGGTAMSLRDGNSFHIYTTAGELMVLATIKKVRRQCTPPNGRLCLTQGGQVGS